MSGASRRRLARPVDPCGTRRAQPARIEVGQNKLGEQ